VNGCGCFIRRGQNIVNRAARVGQDFNLSVRAVVSYYESPDLRAVYEQTLQTRTLALPKVEVGLPGAVTAIL